MYDFQDPDVPYCQNHKTPDYPPLWFAAIVFGLFACASVLGVWMLYKLAVWLHVA